MDTVENLNPIPKHLPQNLIRLAELSQNLWWSWTLEARQLFELIDPTLWYFTHHNPVRLLQEVKPERFQQLVHDPMFVRHYSAVMKSFDEYRLGNGTWYGKKYGHPKSPSIAYFSAEFGLHISIPIYSGGLGILAGDHCKEASDLGVPLVGIGFMYPQG